MILLPDEIREGQAPLAAFAQGLQELGWTVGRKVQIDYRGARAAPGVDRPAPRIVTFHAFSREMDYGISPRSVAFTSLLLLPRQFFCSTSIAFGEIRRAPGTSLASYDPFADPVRAVRHERA